MKNKAAELLDRLYREMVSPDFVNLVYVTPAESLRRQANAIERKEQLMKEIKEYLDSIDITN